MPLIRRRFCAALVIALASSAMSETPFRREPKLRHRGVGKEGSIELSPRSLVEVFGQPTDESWDNESLGGYYFVTPEDHLFTVYFRAYEQSSQSIARLRKAFWTETTHYEFSIGSLGPQGVANFKAWLHSQVKK